MDASVLVRRFGGDAALVRELVTLFLAECPRMLECIRQAVRAGRPDEIRWAAHTFKGAVGNFGDRGVLLAALALEQAGRAGDTAQAPALLADLEREVDRLLASMHDLLAAGACES